MRAIEDVVVLQQVGLERKHLLHAQRPLLIPRPRQAQRFVPRRQLHRTRTRALGQGHAEHLEHDALHVVLWLRLGETKGVDLHAVAESPLGRILHAVALARDFIPQLRERAHLAHLFDKPNTGVDEERDAADHIGKPIGRQLARVAHRVEHRDGCREREGDLLHGGGPGFLKVIRADVDGIPLGSVLHAPRDEVAGETHGGSRREHVRAARQVLLDDVVLRGAGQ